MLIIKILLIYRIFRLVDGANNTTTVVVEVKNRSFEVATRIVGGEAVDIKSYPFTVSIQWRLGSTHHCGGSYIMPRFILSAAHCMVRYNGFFWQAENPRFYLVMAGTSNLWYSPTWQIAVTDAVLPHPEFTYSTMANDIGLFRIAKPLRITPYVNYAPLPLAEGHELFTKNQSSCTVVGWGKTSELSTMTSDTLRHVDVPLMPTKECKRYLTPIHNLVQICAGKKEGGVDACQGDSGGPLICNGTQVGIVSWGYGCAAPNSPGVYCRVDYYIDWIKGMALKNGNNINNRRMSISLFGLIVAAARLLSWHFEIGIFIT